MSIDNFVLDKNVAPWANVCNTILFSIFWSVVNEAVSSQPHNVNYSIERTNNITKKNCGIFPHSLVDNSRVTSADDDDNENDDDDDAIMALQTSAPLVFLANIFAVLKLQQITLFFFMCVLLLLLQMDDTNFHFHLIFIYLLHLFPYFFDFYP